jgi:hypothetical protein
MLPTSANMEVPGRPVRSQTVPSYGVGAISPLVGAQIEPCRSARAQMPVVSSHAPSLTSSVISLASIRGAHVPAQRGLDLRERLRPFVHRYRGLRFPRQRRRRRRAHEAPAAGGCPSRRQSENACRHGTNQQTGPLEDEAYAAEEGFVVTWRGNHA